MRLFGRKIDHEFFEFAQIYLQKDRVGSQVETLFWIEIFYLYIDKFRLIDIFRVIELLISSDRVSLTKNSLEKLSAKLTAHIHLIEDEYVDGILDRFFLILDYIFKDPRPALFDVADTLKNMKKIDFLFKLVFHPTLSQTYVAGLPSLYVKRLASYFKVLIAHDKFDETSLKRMSPNEKRVLLQLFSNIDSLKELLLPYLVEFFLPLHESDLDLLAPIFPNLFNELLPRLKSNSELRIFYNLFIAHSNSCKEDTLYAGVLQKLFIKSIKLDTENRFLDLIKDALKRISKEKHVIFSKAFVYPLLYKLIVCPESQKKLLLSYIEIRQLAPGIFSSFSCSLFCQYFKIVENVVTNLTFHEFIQFFNSYHSLSELSVV